MKLILLSVLIFELVVWAISFWLTVLCGRSQPTKTQETPAGVALLPRWLSWRESWTEPAQRAGLFATWVVLVYGLVLLVTFPAVLLHWLGLWLLGKRH